MQGFIIFLEKAITISQLKSTMKEIFPKLNFYQWNLQDNIVDNEKDKELMEQDILMELSNKKGIFKTLVEFYRFPGDESNSRLNLFVARNLSRIFECKTTINGYSYCDFDQMPSYSLLLENDKAFLIGDCYPDNDWLDNDIRLKNLKIEILKEINLSSFTEKYTDEAQLIS